MRHLIIAALMVVGSLLAVEATVSAFEQSAAVRRETRVTEIPPPPAPAPALHARQASLRLPARPTQLAVAQALPRLTSN